MIGNVRVDLGSLPWQSPMAGMRFKVQRQNGRQLRLVEFSEGFVEPDWCGRGHIGLVLEGSMSLELDGGTVVLQAGDGIMIPPGPSHRHKGTVLTKVVRVVLVEDCSDRPDQSVPAD